MNRKRGIMSNVFKSKLKTQTFCQYEERFTMQNKMPDTSPYQRTVPKNKTFHSTQTLIPQVE